MNKKMKKQILLFLTLIMSMMATAQVTIQMEKEGGVYKVPCTVNGVKMKFIFDTGAATVSMSQTMAQFLLDGEYLSKSDIKGTGKSQLADGSIVNHATIVLRDVEIGGMHIHNIDATVIEGQNTPLLLGQTAIQELGRVSIDGDKLIIHSAEKALSDEQIKELEWEFQRHFASSSYVAAIDCLNRIDEVVGLNEFGVKDLCYCYYKTNQSEKCIQSCKRWLKEFEETSDDRMLDEILTYLASSYYFGQNDYNSAILWYQKELDVLTKASMVELYKDDTPLYYESLANINYLLAQSYYYLDECYQAISYYKTAINLQCKSINVKIENVQTGKVQDEWLGQYLYDYAFCYYQLKNDADGDEVMKLAALCGNQMAIDFCRKIQY